MRKVKTPQPQVDDRTPCAYTDKHLLPAPKRWLFTSPTSTTAARSNTRLIPSKTFHTVSLTLDLRENLNHPDSGERSPPQTERNG